MKIVRGYNLARLLKINFMNITFPTDFNEIQHPICHGAKQWRPKDKTIETFISIVGGGRGLYGDGVNTFEIMIGDDVSGYQSEQGINVILKKHVE